jgi:hypothetical protein
MPVPMNVSTLDAKASFKIQSSVCPLQAQRYGRLTIRRRSKDSLSLASSSSGSPVKLDVERSVSFKDECAPARL